MSLEKSGLFFIMNQAGRIALTCAACAGVVGTGVAVHFATKKAEKKLREKGLEDAPLKEKLKETAVDYILPAGVTAATIGTILISHKASTKEIAALTAAGGLSAKLLTKYKSKIKEIFGEEKYEEVVKEVARENEKDAEEAKQPVIFSSGLSSTSFPASAVPNDTLFYDEFTNEFFYSSLYSVTCAILHLNRNFVLGSCVTYSMFRDFIGLTNKTEYDYEGWGEEFYDSGLCWIDFEIVESEIRDTGEKYFILTPVFAPETLNESDRLNASYTASQSEEWDKMLSEKWQNGGVD